MRTFKDRQREELELYNQDSNGMAETRRKGEQLKQLQSGHAL
jgi:hypothetical protein